MHDRDCRYETLSPCTLHHHPGLQLFTKPITWNSTTYWFFGSEKSLSLSPWQVIDIGLSLLLWKCGLGKWGGKWKGWNKINLKKRDFRIAECERRKLENSINRTRKSRTSENESGSEECPLCCVLKYNFGWVSFLVLKVSFSLCFSLDTETF